MFLLQMERRIDPWLRPIFNATLRDPRARIVPTERMDCENQVFRTNPFLANRESIPGCPVTGTLPLLATARCGDGLQTATICDGPQRRLLVFAKLTRVTLFR